MEITDFKDFYVDLNGDVKASIGDTKHAKFLTTEEKFNSEYFFANSFEELQNEVYNVNTMFDISDKMVFKQYAIKTDSNGNVMGIKIYCDYLNNSGGLNFILVGYDITSVGVETEYYFIGNINTVNKFIIDNKLNYEIKDFETHSPFLFSVKRDEANKISNFKTYYTLKDTVNLISYDIIAKMKESMKFS